MLSKSTKNLSLPVSDKGDFVFVGEGDGFGQVEDEGFSGFDYDAGGAVFFQVFEGIPSYGGDIEAHVMVGFGGFDESPASGGAQLTGAFDHAVGSLDGFDGDDFLFLDGDGLSDVQPAYFFGDSPTELDIAF